MAAGADPIPAGAGLGPRELAEIVELGEAQTVVELVEALDPAVADRYGVRLERIGGAIAMVMREVDVPMFNRIVGLGLREPVTDAVLDEVERLYQGERFRFMVQMSPAVLTDELHRRLEARGLRRMDNWAKMIRGVDPPPEVATDLRIELVGREHAGSCTEIVCAAFGMPPEFGAFMVNLVGRPDWRHYLAFDGERPVATGALYLHGEVGEVTLGATLESHRGRGGQGALMARRIRDAIALGCRWVATETGEDTPDQPNPSYRNMVRTGFRRAYLRPNYIYFPS